MARENSAKLTPEDFTMRAILKLRKSSYKGIHTVYSGFNQAFREYYPGDDPARVTNSLAEQGKIVMHPVRGGAMIYLLEDAPRSRGQDALEKILE